MEGKFEIYTNINITVMLSTKGNEGMHIFLSIFYILVLNNH